jgi:hypothetical protein
VSFCYRCYLHIKAANKQSIPLARLAMHPFGLVTLLQFLWEHEFPSLFIWVAIGLVLSAVFLYHSNQRHKDAPAVLPRRLPLVYITRFLTHRHDFLAWGFKVTNQPLFQFNLLFVRQNRYSRPQIFR